MAKNVENCGNCKFFESDYIANNWADGSCQRFPPVPVYFPGENEAEACVPDVVHSYWCGEWKPITTSQEIPANAVDPEELG